MGVAALEALVPISGVIGCAGESELSHIRVALGVLPKRVAESQGIVIADLGVNSRAERRLRLGSGDRLYQRSLVEVGVENNSVHDAGVFNITTLRVKKERGLLVDRSAEVSVKHFRVIGRNLGR